MRLLGSISDIYRYPVKSFGGERLDACKVESYGLLGDRSYAFIDETKTGWNQYVTARKIPKMLSYQASLIEDAPSAAGQRPEVRITGPDGRIHHWDHELHQEIQALTDVNITMMEYLPARSEVLAVDEACLLIVTDRSLRRLEELWGAPVDARRFRGNLVVAMSDDRIEEEELIGKTLKVGDTLLEVYSKCERCSMITYDPDSIARDASLLKVVHQKLNTEFGLYARVKQVGHVQTGDSVTLLSE
ncbi:MOSC domain-containing protein [Paenibacillus aquistagni]|uniref:Uncharacterized protein n=1 Tax=Paenibacillus aquistagni TaxID=1852522 RepID=A0A1X7IRV4_9BACL|nr:MOSC domain-containing protein [Paenibacillus aquistagni]NMM51123.1 MOSC domain-containing protein [Paenibacillus aquistagni]SMG17901.1 hypothetical protein SAMN06295960_0741 [Paenibacillus aquistagni]